MLSLIWALGLGSWPCSSPVESIAHFNGHQHRQGHGSGVARLEDFAVNAIKEWVVTGALQEVPLGEGQG